MQIQYGSHVFAVPGDVVDHFIRLADETQLKVLLCFLRSDGNSTAEQIASYLKISPEQAEEALQFWLQANILGEGGAPVSGFAFAAPAAAPAQTAAPPAPAPIIIHDTSQNIRLDASEISQMVEESAELKGLFSMAEKWTGNLLNHSTQRSLIWMHNQLQLPAEVIATLLKYCIDIDKCHYSYVEEIAYHWAQDGIHTLEQAEEAVEQMRSAHTYENELRRMFEMKRRPTTKQKEYFDRWQAARYSLELLHYAYEVTIENTEKLNFPYMDKLLTEWTKAGAVTPEQVRSLPKPGTRKPSRTKEQAPITPQLADKLNAYLSAANRFKEDEE